MSKSRSKPRSASEAGAEVDRSASGSAGALSSPKAAKPGSPGGPSGPGGYTVLARRYRSQEFDELVGQEAVVRTLRNAIAQNRVAHAYLFTGTRGVGKTSAARLLAKELCRHPRLDAQGRAVAEVPSEIEAIGAAILRGGDLDVIEIDAASNTGVDNVRDLIAGAGLAPARCPYKVYIIDEVHMLSRSAFNALLKIMEEPPAHVKFILCTTEPQKVPATIQSRCQRFDFRGIPAARIASHLRSVLEQEGFGYEEEAVLHISRLAAGSMRDALTLLDRLLAAAEGKLDAQLVETMLGLPDASVVRALVDAVAAGDAAAALAHGDELIQRGNTVDRAIDALVEHFRNLMVLSVCGPQSGLFEGGAEAREAASAQAARFDSVGLVHRIAQCEAAGRAARSALAPRAVFDALVVRLALAEQLVSVEEAGGQAGQLARASARQVAGAPGASPIEKKKPEFGHADGSASAVGIGPAAARRGAEHGAVATGSGDSFPAVARPSADDAVQPLTLESLWDSVLAAAERGIDAALVSAVRPVAFDGQTLRLMQVDDAAAMTTSLNQHTQRLRELVQRAAGRRVNVTLERPKATATERPPQAGLEEVRRHPLIQQAMELFDAVVVGTSRATSPAVKGEPDHPERAEPH